VNARLPLLSVLLLGLTACNTVRVTSDYDPEADFRELRTWKWMDDGPVLTDIRVASELVQKRIRTATETVLAERGYQQVDRDADFEVAWTASMEDKVDYQTYNTAHVRGRYSSYWTESSAIEGTEYTEGTLVIDIHKSGTMNLIWRGIGVGTVRQHGTPEERQARTKKAVQEILSCFPPKQKR